MEVGSDRDYGIAIEWAGNPAIHAALAVVGSPVAQAATPAASAVAFKAHVIAQLVAIQPNCRVPTLSSVGLSNSVFHHLTTSEYMAAQNMFLPVNNPWGANLILGGRSVGKWYMVNDTGRGRNEALQAVFTPFNGE